MTDDLGLIVMLSFSALFYGPVLVSYFWKKRKQKIQDDKEQKEWIVNTEHKYRDLHTYPEDWGMRRKFISKKFNYTCCECGRKGWLGFHIHHKIPLSKGGTNSLDNLMYLCRWCHERHHPHMIEERYKRYKKIKEIRKKTYWKKKNI